MENPQFVIVTRRSQIVSRAQKTSISKFIVVKVKSEFLMSVTKIRPSGFCIVWSVYSNPGRGNIFSSSPKRSDRHWDPPSLPFIGYRDCFPGVKRPGRDVDLHTAPRLRMSGAIEPFPLHTFMSWTWNSPFYKLLWLLNSYRRFGEMPCSRGSRFVWNAATYLSNQMASITKNVCVLHIQSNTICVIHKNSLLLNQHNGDDVPQNGVISYKIIIHTIAVSSVASTVLRLANFNFVNSN